MVVRYACLGTLLLCGSAVMAGAPDTIVVNHSQDVVSAGDGLCTLREAIATANTGVASGPGATECQPAAAPVVIEVPAGLYTIGIPGTSEDMNASGDLDIRVSLTLQGDGMEATVIDGSGLDRVFDVHGAGLAVVIADMTVRNGRAPDTTDTDPSGRDGGGIRLAMPGNEPSTLTLLRTSVRGNVAGDGIALGKTGARGGRGGGVHAHGHLVLIDSVVEQNSAGRGEGTSTLGGWGGGIAAWAPGSLFAQRTRFTGNRTGPPGADGIMYGLGGGIASNVPIELVEVEIAGNRAGDTAPGPHGFGGGIAHVGIETLVLRSSSVVDNHARRGGGLFSSGGNDMRISNSTIADNAATDLGGGGMFFYRHSGSTLNARIDFTTVTGNTSQSPGSGLVIESDSSEGDLIYSITNSIIAGNHGATSECWMVPLTSLVSLGHNLVSAGCRGLEPSDIVGVPPGLAPLQHNGGFARTMLPGIDSSALDAGNCALSNIFVDQRGQARPVVLNGSPHAADGCDIGAVELTALDLLDDPVFADGFEAMN